MTAYNFPNSPSDGDTVTSNGITYTYSSSKTRWDAAAASGSSTTVYATIDLLPLSGASTGDQAYVSGNNRLYIWNGSGWYNIALINTTPSISGASASYALATDGTATTVTITATDPEGIPITYSIASDTSGNVATVTQGTGSNTNVFTITPTTNTANAGTFSLTFRASDGVNIATAVSEFTLLLSVANSNYTTALITSVGANNAVNNSFDDASTNNHTITANGNVTQGTFSPYRHGGNAVSFAGTNSSSQNYLWINAAIVPATGSWTYESWVRVDGKSDGEKHSLISWYTNSVAGRGNITVRADSDTNPGIVFVYVDGMSSYPQSTTRIDDGAWHHVVVERDGNVWSVWIDGTREDQETQNVTLNTSVNTRLGHSINTAATNHSGFKGLMRDVRFSTSARYQGAATINVPTEDQATTTGYALLCCQSFDPFTDKTDAREITVYSSTTVKQVGAGPYDHSGYTSGTNGGSMYFDGSGDYLSLPVSDSLKFGTGAFTIEFWMWNQDTNHINNSSYYPCQIQIGTFGQNNIAIRFNNAGTEFRSSINGTNTSHTVSIPEQTWSHVAFTRDSSGDCRFFLGGTQIGSTYSNTSTIDPVSETRIGRENWTNGEYFKGSLSDVRVVKGSSVYTSAFTPPTAPLTAITNTSLLLNGTDAGIIDKSQSVKTITLNGDVKSSTTQTKYLSSSMAFDGTGDYLSIGDDNSVRLGSGKFTVECWIYMTSLARTVFVDKYDGTSAGWQIQYRDYNNVNHIAFSTNAGHYATTPSDEIQANTWYHVAAVRDSSDTLKIYINGVEKGSSSNYTQDLTSTTELNIGAQTYSVAAGYMNGYISDIRITKGLARYTASDETANIPSAALEG